LNLPAALSDLGLFCKGDTPLLGWTVPGTELYWFYDVYADLGSPNMIDSKFCFSRPKSLENDSTIFSS
jgi:hypothetical protein